jgi:hypothetical protein
MKLNIPSHVEMCESTPIEESESRYTIVETTGCTAFNFTINDKILSDYTSNELDDILNYLFIKVKEGLKENTILYEDVVKLFQPDDWDHDPNVCEQCGDTVSTTTWII